MRKKKKKPITGLYAEDIVDGVITVKESDEVVATIARTAEGWEVSIPVGDVTHTFKPCSTLFEAFLLLEDQLLLSVTEHPNLRQYMEWSFIEVPPDTTQWTSEDWVKDIESHIARAVCPKTIRALKSALEIHRTP